MTHKVRIELDREEAEALWQSADTCIPCEREEAHARGKDKLKAALSGDLRVLAPCGENEARAALAAIRSWCDNPPGPVDTGGWLLASSVADLIDAALEAPPKEHTGLGDEDRERLFRLAKELQKAKWTEPAEFLYTLAPKLAEHSFSGDLADRELWRRQLRQAIFRANREWSEDGSQSLWEAIADAVESVVDPYLHCERPAPPMDQGLPEWLRSDEAQRIAALAYQEAGATAWLPAIDATLAALAAKLDDEQSPGEPFAEASDERAPGDGPPPGWEEGA